MDSTTIIIVTAIISFGVVAASLFWQGAKPRGSGGDGAFRRLAEEAARNQKATVEALEKTAREIAELRARATEIERMLKEVG